jgi:hypothetical protein
MSQARGHVDPGSSLCLLEIVAQADSGLSFHEEQHSRFGRGVFGKFLALCKSEHDSLKAIILEDRSAQDAIVGRFSLLGQIEDIGVGCHGVRFSM